MREGGKRESLLSAKTLFQKVFVAAADVGVVASAINLLSWREKESRVMLTRARAEMEEVT